jgi:hypothetical protein
VVKTLQSVVAALAAAAAAARENMAIEMFQVLHFVKNMSYLSTSNNCNKRKELKGNAPMPERSDGTWCGGADDDDMFATA